MIRVDRSRVTLPDDLVHKLRMEQEKLIAFHKEMGAGSKRSQQRTFDYSILSQTRPFLRDLFNNKCALCESLLVGQSGDLENYRPKGTIEERDGTVLREGYWWLAHEWDNLHIACATCNRLHKRNKFPIAGPRAAPMTKGVALQKEAPLLLDPCADDPAVFLSFLPDGTVRPGSVINPPGEFVKGASNYERGAATIEILGLNRKDLVEARYRLRQTVEKLLPQLAKRPSADALKEILGIECPSLAPHGNGSRSYSGGNWWRKTSFTNCSRPSGLSRSTSQGCSLIGRRRANYARPGPRHDEQRRLRPFSRSFRRRLSRNPFS